MTSTKSTKGKSTTKAVATKGKGKAPAKITATQSKHVAAFVAEVKQAGTSSRVMAHLFHELVRPAKGKGLDVDQVRLLLNARIREANVVHSNPSKPVGEAMRAAQITDALSVATGKRQTPKGMTDDQWLMVSKAAKSEGTRDRTFSLIQRRKGEALAITAADVSATGQSAARLTGKGNGKGKGKGNTPAPPTFDSLLTELVSLVDAIASGKADKGQSKGIARWDEVSAHVTARLASLA